MSARTVTYQCVRCPTRSTAPLDSALAMLALCRACFEARLEAGVRAQKAAVT